MPGKRTKPELVSSPRNPLVQRFRRAAHTGQLIEGCLAVEGWHLVEEAVRSAGCGVKTAFATADGIRRLRRLLSGTSGQPRIIEMTERAFGGLSETETPQGVAALVRMPQWKTDDVVSGGRPLLALAGVQDPGNVGTIVRSAEAFGAAACLLLTGCASPFNPKAVRASAGSIFRIPVFPRMPTDKAMEICRAGGFRCVGLSAREGTTLEALPPSERVALFVGSEAHGLPSDLLARMDRRVRIPVREPVESLNAALAAGVALYEISRQKRKV